MPLLKRVSQGLFFFTFGCLGLFGQQPPIDRPEAQHPSPQNKLRVLETGVQKNKGLHSLETRTTINPVYIRGTCEQTGIMQFVVNPFELPAASPENPLYIRLLFEKEAILCDTLVWSHSNNQGNLTFDPIYLPIQIDGFSFKTNNLVSAPPDTVSIVRWKKGENQIWLKIQRPGSTWIKDSVPRDLKWTVGIAARTTWEQNQDRFQDGRANLPAATRNLEALDQAHAVSTLICADLLESTLFPAPAPDIFSLMALPGVILDSNTTNVETAETMDEIELGNDVFPIIGDREVARGYDFDCGAEKVAAGQPTATDLCPESSTSLPIGLIKLASNSSEILVNCGAGWGVRYGSVLRLDVEKGGTYGFRVLLDEFDQPIPAEGNPDKVLLDPESLEFKNAPNGPPLGSIETLFQAPTGEYLCKNVAIEYLGEGTPGTITLVYSAAVWERVGGFSQSVNLIPTFFSVNRNPSKVIDLPPFDGEDQYRNCPGSVFRFEFEDWYLGELIACDVCKCEADFDCDYVVGDGDLSLMLSQVFTQGPMGDLNLDDQVDIIDTVLLLNRYGSCLN